jgi:hypothetical protein
MKFGVEVVHKVFRLKASFLNMKSGRAVFYLGGKLIYTLPSAFIEVNGKIQYHKPVRHTAKEFKFRKIRRSEIPTLLQRVNVILLEFSTFFFRFEYSSIQEASNKQLLSQYYSGHTGTVKVILRFGT